MYNCKALSNQERGLGNHKHENILSSSSLVKKLNNDEYSQFQRRVKENFKISETVTIPLKNKKSYRATFMKGNMGMTDGSPFSIIGDIMENENLRESIELITEHLPDRAKIAFLESGFDLKMIAERGLMIPEYKKALRYCDIVKETFDNDPDFPRNKVNNFNPFDKGKINDNEVTKIRSNLEEKLQYSSGNRNFNSNLQYIDDDSRKDADKLTKFQQYDLANEFKKVNNHHMQTAMADIGIKNIKIAGNAIFFITDNQIGKVIKVTMTVGSAILEVFDKTWKAQNFNLYNEENRELTPMDLLNINSVRGRRDKLVQHNVKTLIPMLPSLDKHTGDDPKQNMIVSGLLKGFFVKPEEIREKVRNDENVTYELEEKMKRLYRF